MSSLEALEDLLFLAFQIPPTIQLMKIIETCLACYENNSLEFQADFVLLWNLVTKDGAYNPPQRWAKDFFKKIERILLSLTNEFSDEFMELLVQSQLSTEDMNDVGYANYILKDSGLACGFIQRAAEADQIVRIRVDRIHNQVGMKIWSAGIYLGDLCLQLFGGSDRSLSLEGKTLLELGAGVGITGLLLAQGLCAAEAEPKKILLTDFHEDVLSNLSFNISLNMNRTPKGCQVLAQSLDWSQEAEFIDPETQTFPVALQADMLLAADCTYSEDICLLLIQLFQVYLNGFSSKQASQSARLQSIIASDSSDHLNGEILIRSLLDYKVPFVLIACTLRNERTFQYFLSHLSQAKTMHAVSLTEWSASFLGQKGNYHIEQCQDVKLFCILPALLLPQRDRV